MTRTWLIILMLIVVGVGANYALRRLRKGSNDPRSNAQLIRSLWRGVFGGPRIVQGIGGRMFEFDSDEGATIRLPLAPVALRLLAATIDHVLYGVIAVICVEAFTGWDITRFYERPGLAILSVVLVYLIPLCVEWLMQGRTLGALAMGLQIVDERGEPLTWTQITLRRVLATLEPATAAGLVLALPMESVHFGLVIVLMVMAMNAQYLHLFLTDGRQRISDVIARVIVVQAPAPIPLLTPLPPTVTPGFALSAHQLDMYGSYELHVMEQALHAAALGDEQPMAAAARSIRKKLALPPLPLSDYDLVLNVYNLLKLDLEAKQRVGALRLRKRPGVLPLSIP